jgi:AcrR family transcriptional regulator
VTGTTARRAAWISGLDRHRFHRYGTTEYQHYGTHGYHVKREREQMTQTVRERILEAAFTAFMKNGYAATSTIEIATSARVSKRELYAVVGNKQEMLMACISERSKRLQAPADLPAPRDRESLAQILSSFGAQLLREASDPAVIAVFRLAIAETTRAAEVARTLDSVGRGTSRATLRKIVTQAKDEGLLDDTRPADLVEQFIGLLWGDLMISLLLGVADRPKPREITARAQNAAAAFLRLHALPTDA